VRAVEHEFVHDLDQRDAPVWEWDTKDRQRPEPVAVLVYGHIKAIGSKPELIICDLVQRVHGVSGNTVGESEISCSAGLIERPLDVVRVSNEVQVAEMENGSDIRRVDSRCRIDCTEDSPSRSGCFDFDWVEQSFQIQACSRNQREQVFQ